MGVYSGCDSFLIKYDGKVFLERRSISWKAKYFLKGEVPSVWSILAGCRNGGIQSEAVCSYMSMCIIIIFQLICAQIFQKSWSQNKILGATRVTWSKFHTKDPYKLGATIWNLVAMVT